MQRQAREASESGAVVEVDGGVPSESRVLRRVPRPIPMQLKQRREKSKEQQDPEAIRSVRGEVVHRGKTVERSRNRPAPPSPQLWRVQKPEVKKRRRTGKSGHVRDPLRKRRQKRPVVGPRTEQRDRMHPRHQRLEYSSTEAGGEGCAKAAAKPTAKPAARHLRNLRPSRQRATASIS